MTTSANPVNWFEIPVEDLARGSGGLMPKASGGDHGAIAQFEDSERNPVALYSDS